MNADMEAIRANCVERIVAKLKLRDDLAMAGERLAAHVTDVLLNNGRRNFKQDVNGVINHLSLLQDSVQDDIWMDIEQFASLFARDVIVATVHEAGDLEPVVWLTGNSFMPPYRSWDEIEQIWRHDDEGTYIHEMWERIEAKCTAANVMIASPDYDNCLYAVNTAKWEPSEAAEKGEHDVDDINDLWSHIDPEPAKEPGYKLEAKFESVAIQVTGNAGETARYVIGDTVKFRQPNGDTSIHTIAQIGRDSDDDVWVKLEDGQQFFDWADILDHA